MTATVQSITTLAGSSATPAAPESLPEDSEPHKPAAPIANKQVITMKKPQKYCLPLPANSDANSDSDLLPPKKKKKKSKKGKGERVKFDLAQEQMDVDHEEEQMDKDDEEVPETPQESPPVSALKNNGKGKAKVTVGPKVLTLELGKWQAIPDGMVAYDDEALSITAISHSWP